MKYPTIVTLTLFSSILIGCTDNATVDNLNKEEEQEVVVTDVNESAEPTPVVAEVEEGYPSYSDVPENRYIDVFSDNFGYAQPLMAANTTRDLSVEDKLNAMFPEYRSATDPFEKQDLAAKLTPSLEAEMKKYEGPIGIKMPLGDIKNQYHPYQKVMQKLSEETDEKINFSLVSMIGLDEYNFDTKSFPVSNCTYEGIFQMLGPDNKISLPKEHSNGFLRHYMQTNAKAPTEGTIRIPTSTSWELDQCGLLVEDRDLAQKIQNLNSSMLLNSSGWMYYVVDEADVNTLHIKPVRADITFYDETNGEELLEKQLIW